MPSGGARARSGPPPDPNALRRDRDKNDWLRLDPSPRDGDPPAWPLSRPGVREQELWRTEWTRPQARVWEQRGQTLEVALFVRSVIVAEGKNATAGDRALPLRFMDDLGISAGGLAKNRWLLDEVLDHKVTRHDDPDRASAKSRFKTLEGGAA